MFKTFFSIMVLVIFMSGVSGIVAAETVVGLITDIDVSESEITVNNITYNIEKDCYIKLNGVEVNLTALGSPYPGYYNWGILSLDDNNFISGIKAYYEVVEGEVEDISLEDGYLIVKEYRQDNDNAIGYIKYSNMDSVERDNSSAETPGMYYFPSVFKDYLSNISISDHIVFIVALDQILYLP
ncbi:MAG: hypothetical protein ACLFUI_03685 [Halanaerobiales bacterium]